MERNIRKGEILTEDMICLKSPGNGLMWRNRQEIIGKKAKKNISVDCTLFINDFE